MLDTMAQRKIRVYFFFFLVRIFFSRRNPGLKEKRKAVGSVQKAGLNWILSPALNFWKMVLSFALHTPKQSKKLWIWIR